MPVDTHALPNVAADSADARRLRAELRDNYSHGARVYDAERSVNEKARRFFESSYAALDEMLGEQPASAIHIDMPVGTGRMLLHLVRRGRRHRMIGIDIAAGMLQVCKANVAKSNAGIPLSFGDAFRLPLADGSVDVLTSLRFFHLFPRRLWPGLLAEMHRVVAPGGFIIAEFRNIFRAAAGAIVKEFRDRWLHKDQPHAFIAPTALRALFRQWDRHEVRGVGLDGMTSLARVLPGWTTRLERSTRVPPLCYLTKELLVKAWKGGSPG